MENWWSQVKQELAEVEALSSPDAHISSVEASPSDPARSRHHRKRRLVSAWVTTIPSKAITFVLQVVTVPIAYRAIGPAQFAAFAAVTSAIVVLNFLNLGMGGAVVTPLAAAAASHDRERESRLFWSTLTPLTVVFAVALAVALPFLALVPLKSLFGVVATEIPLHALRWAALIACFGTLAAVPLSVFDNMRQAYQETHISTLFGIATNASLCVGLVLVAWFIPTLVAFVAVMSLVPVLIRILNAASLLIRRPYLTHFRTNLLSIPLVRSLAVDGVSYAGAAALGTALVYEWPVYFIARVRPVLESATFAVYLRLILLFISFGAGLIQPLWPAIADAAAQMDSTWVRRIVRKARFAALAYGACGLLTLGLGMNVLMRMWLRRPVHVPPIDCWLAGSYLVLAIWEYVHWPILLGLGRMRSASHVSFLRAAAFAVAVPTCAHYGQTGTMWLMCASVLFISAWYYPRLLHRSLAA